MRMDRKNVGWCVSLFIFIKNFHRFYSVDVPRRRRAGKNKRPSEHVIVFTCLHACSPESLMQSHRKSHEMHSSASAIRASSIAQCRDSLFSAFSLLEWYEIAFSYKHITQLEQYPVIFDETIRNGSTRVNIRMGEQKKNKNRSSRKIRA